MLLIKYFQSSRTNIQQKLQLKPYIKSFSTTPNHKMPLVDPVTNSAGDNANKTQSMTMEWMNKLAGKTIGDQSNETVCISIPSF
jgi:hypothetical protein